MLEITHHDAICRVKLNRPAALNSLCDELLNGLSAALKDLATRTDTRVVILEAEGKAFCAGHDLKEMTAARANADGGAAYFKDLFERCSDLMMTIQTMPQPVIAQVHGLATAAGCQLVATCDLAVASDNVTFGVNGVNIGLFCSTPMVALSRNIPRKFAFEMLTTGEFITASRAAEIGLINKAVPAERLADETTALAQKIAAKLGAAVRIGKEAFYTQAAMPTDEAYAYTGTVMAQNMMLDDTAEGIAAFIDKRPPTWQQ